MKDQRKKRFTATKKHDQKSQQRKKEEKKRDRANLVDDVHEVGGVREITVVKLEADGGLVAVAVDVVDALGVEARGSADDAVHFVPLTEESSVNAGKTEPRTEGDGGIMANDGWNHSRRQGSESVGLDKPQAHSAQRGMFAVRIGCA